MGRYFEVEIKARSDCEATFEEISASIRCRSAGFDQGSLLVEATRRERAQLAEISIGAEETLATARAAWPRVELDPATERAAARWDLREFWLIVTDDGNTEPAIRAGGIAIAESVDPRRITLFFDARYGTWCLVDRDDPEAAVLIALRALDEICGDLRSSFPAVDEKTTWEVFLLLESLVDRILVEKDFRLSPKEVDTWLDAEPHGSLYTAATETTGWEAARWLLFWASHGHRVYYAG